MKPFLDTETTGNGGFYFFLLSWMLSHFHLHHFGSPLSTEPVNSTLWSRFVLVSEAWRAAQTLLRRPFGGSGEPSSGDDTVSWKQRVSILPDSSMGSIVVAFTVSSVKPITCCWALCVCVSMWLCNRHSYHREWCWGVKVELKQQPLG